MKKNLSISLLCLTLFLTSCNLFTQKEDESENDSAELQTEEIERQPVIEYGFNLDEFDFQRDTIRSGDSFGSIMQKNGFSIGEIHEINEKVKDSFDSRKLVVGKPYILVHSKEQEEKPSTFIYQNDIINYTVVHLADSVYAEKLKRPVSIKRKELTGVIHSSLSVTMDKAGASPALIHELAALYQWKIDFFRIQKGDHFKLIYKEKFVNDTIFAGIDEIEAALFSHHGSPYYAFQFGEDDNTGFTKYYDEEANSLQNFFLKAPVKYTRISSRYTPRRFHPVQKRWKAHLGTDYAAPTGTPIHSTADGVVEVSAYTKYNGNYVKVRHNNKYTTQYLHMSKRQAKVGQRVKQGDVIGYVGQTGLATGPHVCYRFWVNGQQVDPYRQKMPSSEPLAESKKPEFFEKIQSIKRELDNMDVQDYFEEEENNNLAKASY